MKNRFLPGLLLILFIVSACTPSGAAPAEVVSTPAQEQPGGAQTPVEQNPSPQAPVSSGSVVQALQYIYEIPPDPLRVSPSLDTGQAVEALISSQGGSLSASGADGTTFQLDIPAGALASDTLIRMTPLSALEGMPFGSQSYAVQLEPEGLQFYDFAILTITPPEALPVDQQIFFGYQGLGESLVLAAPVVDSQEIKLRIDHFSGYGVTKGFLADIEPVRARIGGQAEARLQSAIAEQLGKARQQALLGDESAGDDIDWEGFFRQWEEEVLKPRIAAAGESCAAGRLAIQSVLTYERQRQLLGIEESDGSLATALNGLMDSVAEVCMQEEYEMCADDHIIHRIIPAWLGLERQYQLLGIIEGGASTAVLENAKNYVKRCLTFEMQFHSEGTFNDGGGGGYDSVVDSKIKIQFNPGTLKINGTAPLVNTAFEFRAEGCSVTSNRGGSTFEAMSLVYIADTSSPTDQVGHVRDFSFIYYPGNTTESFTIQCEDSPSYTSPPSPLWTGIFLPLHEGEMSQEAGGFIAEDWEIFGDEYFAKKEWIKDSAGDGITEVGTLKLYHKPE